MKPLVPALAAALSLFIALPAYCVTHVWFTATSTSQTASILSQGASGAMLDLACTGSGQSCTWDVTIRFANDPGDHQIVCWATDLYTSAVNGKISVDSNTFEYLDTSMPSHFTQVYGYSGPLLLRYPAGCTFGMVGSQGGALAHFTLKKLKAPGNSNNIDSINAFSGDVEWIYYDPNNPDFYGYPDMQAAANPPIPEGGMGGTDLGESIRIYNSPEPSLYGVLSLVGVFGLRTRRYCSVSADR